MRCAPGDLPRPDPSLHQTGSEGQDGKRGRKELALLEHFGMVPSSDILDVGCGIGRLAYECASYLDADATYTGLDIAPVPIAWLNANYAPRLDGFRFDLLDVHSERYRPDADLAAEHVRFPYDDACFDVVCAFEVFMHLSLDGVRNYLNELARVLRPGGLAVVTLVAIYPDEQELFHDGRTYVQVGEGVHTLFPRRTSVSMAYDVDLVRSLVAEAGLDELGLIKGQVHSRRERRDEMRRERRQRQVGERLAEAGLDEADILERFGPISLEPSPPVPSEDEETALSHPCDLFATRKRTVVRAG